MDIAPAELVGLGYLACVTLSQPYFVLLWVSDTRIIVCSETTCDCGDSVTGRAACRPAGPEFDREVHQPGVRPAGASPPSGLHATQNPLTKLLNVM